MKDVFLSFPSFFPSAKHYVYSQRPFFFLFFFCLLSINVARKWKQKMEDKHAFRSLMLACNEKKVLSKFDTRKQQQKKQMFLIKSNRTHTNGDFKKQQQQISIQFFAYKKAVNDYRNTCY